MSKKITGSSSIELQQSSGGWCNVGTVTTPPFTTSFDQEQVLNIFESCEPTTGFGRFDQSRQTFINGTLYFAIEGTNDDTDKCKIRFCMMYRTVVIASARWEFWE